jgi:hypothetical protein
VERVLRVSADGYQPWEGGFDCTGAVQQIEITLIPVDAGS